MARCSCVYEAATVNQDKCLKNDENGVDDLMEHLLRSHAITSLYVFIYLFQGINFVRVITLSCNFINY